MTFNKSNVIVSGSRSSLSEYANYTTVYPKPAMVGGKIVLTQDMINKQNVKYIIKWNFDLDDETITVPEGCLIEFDGGSFSNGTLVGNETILVYNQEEEDVFKNVSLEGSFERSTSAIADKMDNTNGMAKIYLKKNKPLAAQLTQPNTIYVIQYDFSLTEDVTIPSDCTLKFEGGSISGPYEVLFDNTRIDSIQEGVILCDVDGDSTFANTEINIDWFLNEEIRNTDCSAIINKLFEISCKALESKYTILFGAHIYNIASQIKPVDVTSVYYKRYIKIKGCGATSQFFKSKIKLVAEGTITRENAIDTMFGDADINTEYHIEDMCFDADAKALYTFRNNGISGSIFKNVLFMGALNACFYTQNSYCVNFEDCVFRGRYSDINSATSVTYWGAFLGQGACNAINFNRCIFRASCVGLYYGNGENINITGCTLEGQVSTAIAISFGQNVNIDGCYFEDNGEARNLYISGNEYSVEYTGVRIEKYDEYEYSSPNTIFTDIIVGVNWLSPTSHISEQKWLRNYDLNKRWNDGGYGDIPKCVSIKNCSSQRCYWRSRGNFYFKNPTFVYSVCAAGLSVENCSLIMLDKDKKVYDSPLYEAYLFAIFAVDHKISSSDIVLNNNELFYSPTDADNINVVYVNIPNDSNNYAISAAKYHSLYPFIKKVKKSAIKQDGDYTGPAWYGRGVKALGSNTLTVDLDSQYSIKAGDVLFIDFFLKSYSSTTFTFTINGKSIQNIKGHSPMDGNNKLGYYSIVYIADADYTLSSFELVFSSAANTYISEFGFNVNSSTI